MVRLGITLPEAFAIDVVYWTGRRAEEPRRRRRRRRDLQGVPRHAALAPLTSMIALDDVLVTAYSPDPAGGADRVVRLLGPVTLELVEHRVAIVGANGSGKSTLARLLNGLVLPSSGTVRVDGLDTARDGAAVRRQGRVHVHRPRRPAGHADAGRGRRAVPAPPAADAGGAGRRRPRRAGPVRSGRPRGGSRARPVGGQRQLLALASVLATEPAVLVCDEPTTLLDLRWRGVVDALLADLDQQVVVVTHDLDAALQADRVLVVDDGSVVFDGDPAAGRRPLPRADAGAARERARSGRRGPARSACTTPARPSSTARPPASSSRSWPCSRSPSSPSAARCPRWRSSASPCWPSSSPASRGTAPPAAWSPRSSPPR